MKALTDMAQLETVAARRELRIREESASDTRIGRLLVEAGAMSEQDIDRVVAAQRDNNMRFGETARTLGLVDEAGVQRALARQFSYPYVFAGDSALDSRLVAAHQPFSRVAEQLRALRSQLVLRWLNERRKILVVTSAHADEGASLLAANLAIVFAQLGERTLLVDANFRGAVQHELFGLRASVGLSDILARNESFKRTIAPIDPFDNLSVLTAGAMPPNPQELLSRVEFAFFMETQPAAFDIVILDTAPALEYADAQIVAARAQGCLFSVRRRETRAADVTRMLELFSGTGGMMLGAVVTD
jgi:chain length determinant protein tyrosine kinase EpsG